METTTGNWGVLFGMTETLFKKYIEYYIEDAGYVVDEKGVVKDLFVMVNCAAVK